MKMPRLPVQRVSFVELKAVARKYLSESSVLRKLILKLPDTMSREAGLAKAEVFVTLLYEELGRG